MESAKRFLLSKAIQPTDIQTMTTSSHNGAVNFHSYIESGVDPRTGTFSANLLLGTLLEPDFDVRLCYSPLNQKDFGFGRGWRIPVTIYNTKSKILSLSDGRVYEVEEENKTDKLKLKGNMGEVHAMKVTQPEGIKITYRDTGIIEWLQKKGNWYACTARTSPSGQALYFKWNEDNSESPKITLSEIFKATTPFNTVDDKDIKKTLLLSISMEASEVSIVFWPKKNEQRTFSLTLDQKHLTHLNNTSFTPALQWAFGYDESPSTSRLKTITSPLGKVESVTYSPYGRVETQDTFIASAHTRASVAESPSWTDCYRYHRVNLGIACVKTRGTLHFNNYNSADLILEHIATLYENEHLLEILKIEFIGTIFSAEDVRYILYKQPENSPKEFSLRGALKRTHTSYSSAHYALPANETTYIIDSDTAQESPPLTKTYTWDDYGRLIKKNNDDQTTDEYSYINKDGTENALVETHVHTGVDSTITNKYDYSRFDVAAHTLKSIPKQQSNFLHSMSRATTGAPYIEKSNCEYFDAPGQFSHGKLKQQQMFLLDSSAVAEDAVPSQATTNRHSLEGKQQDIESTIMGFDEFFAEVEEPELQRFLLASGAAVEDTVPAIKDPAPTQTTTYRYTLEGEKQSIESTIIGFDGSFVAVETVKSIYTGLTLKEKDIDGNISDYSWDPLSRLTKLINNSTTPYRTEETFTHGIIDSTNTYAKVFGSEQPSACFKGYILQRDTAGRKILTGHDPHNHEVQTWIFHEAEPGTGALQKWNLAEEKRYDAARRIINHVLIETDDLTTQRVEYKTVYLTPYSYWTYHERAPEKYDITHTLINEIDKTRITTYIDSETLTEPNYYYTLSTTLERPVHEAYVCWPASNTTYDGKSLKSYAVPNLYFKPGKNKCWSRMERVDSRGNVIEQHIYTMDVKADENHHSSSTLIPVLHSSKTYSYNEQNAVVSFSDEYCNLTTFIRDAYNRPSVITRPDTSKLEYAYAAHSDKSLITQLTASSAGTTVSLGTQVFDGLDRLKESNSGGRRQTFEYSGGLHAPTKTLKPDGKHLQYDVIRELGGVIKSIKAEGIEHNFDYFTDSGLLKEYSDQSGYKSVLTYDSQKNVIQEKITPLTGQQTKTLSKSFSPTGKCIAFTDAATKQQLVTYTNGKIATSEDSDSKIANEYGAFDKIIRQMSTDKLTKKTLITDYTYDVLGNETSRTITTSGKRDKLVISQTLRKNNQLATRTVIDGKKTLRDETFTYNSVDMLINYACAGSELPLDGYGKPISTLEFTYDTFANVTQCVTHFGDAKDTATFFYENARDPCQLTRITHTHNDYEKLIELGYDANGCMTKNEKGQTLAYDALNRLASLKDGKDTYLYHYDPKGKLTSRTKLKIRSEWYYQPGGEYPLLSNQVIGQANTRVTRMAEQVTAIVTEANGSSGDAVKLIGVDRMNSPVIVLEGDGSSSTQKYSPSGHPNSALVVGQSGELYDDIGGVYHLGERQYSPRLFRFTTPDSWSPFGEAGPNCYTYLDPVNCRDPEGHLSGWAWFGIAMGVLAIVLGVVTLGASVSAMAAFGATYAIAFAAIGGVANIAAGAVLIAASVISDSDPALSNTLEWVSFGLAVVGAAFSMGAGFVPGASRMAMRGVRAAAPKLGRSARYAVRARVVEGLEMKPISSVITRSGVEMEMKFMGGSRYAFSTSSSVTSGIQSAMSGVFVEVLARISAQPAVRVVGTTMGMMALLGLGIGAKQHAQKQAAG